MKKFIGQIIQKLGAYFLPKSVKRVEVKMEQANEEGQWFTVANMFRTLNKKNPAALRGISAKQLSYRLTAMGFKPRHTNHGNFYHVVRMDAA